MLDLRRISFDNGDLYAKLISELNLAFNPRPLQNLTRLHIQGGSVYSDQLYPNIEDLCRALCQNGLKLSDLHLPVMSNKAMEYVAEISTLQRLKCDRTRCFNRKGLLALSAEESKCVESLQELHIGVFKQHLFQKQDVYEFFCVMKNLKSFSLMEENRALIKVGNLYREIGDKVMVYSVVKMGIVEAEFSHSQTKSFQCQLREIKVVDRRLKPKYLLKVIYGSISGAETDSSLVVLCPVLGAKMFLIYCT